MSGSVQHPQGLKPSSLHALNGTAEAVPLPKPSASLLKRSVLFVGIFLPALFVGAASAQNSPPTIYADSFRKGPTHITEDKFEQKLTSADPSYKQRLRDSSGTERYDFAITPKVSEGEGNDKITSWTVALYDLRHGVYGNVLQFDQEFSEQPRDNLYWLNPASSAPVPILARRIIKVEGFYFVFQVKDFHQNPPASGYLDSMTVQCEFTNRDPRAVAENK